MVRPLMTIDRPARIILPDVEQTVSDLLAFCWAIMAYDPFQKED